MSRSLPPCDHDECGPVKCERQPDPAALAFDRSEGYEFQGEPIVWSISHHYAWLAIVREMRSAWEKACLAGVWLGQLNKAELRKVERAWRRDPEEVIEQIDDFAAEIHPEGAESEEAQAVCKQMMADVKASDNEIDTSEPGEGGGPPK